MNNTRIFKDAEEASKAVAELIRSEAATKKAEGKSLNIAVSGGSTPRLLFTLLGDNYEEEISWDVIRFFWVDERCVEPTDPDSNFGMTYDTLLQHTFVPGENIFRMKGEEVPEVEVERYQKLLWEKLPAKNGLPCFDLILLGMGGDGHTASIFPTEMELLDSEFTVAVGVHPASGQKRITLTGNTICNAKEVVFLITGENKAEILGKIARNENAEIYPAALIASRALNVSFYLDKDAAEKL